MAERQFGPYRLIRQIAVGGMAEIHLAKTAGIAGFEKYVAIKMIHPNFAEDEQFIQMLVDEAKIAVQLTHGNIAQTFDLGRVGETYYITMEYVDGADLYKLLRRGSEQDIEMPLDVCAFIGKEVASALDHAHRKRDHLGKSLGIVHRDVSPQNVLVSYAGEIKLVDFGIAKATMKARQTAVGVIKGKYYYMSPEQAWGDPIDFRSDIFSAGIVLYEMITGQMLYLEEDLHKLLDMARRADIAPPSKLRRGIPPQLERIVMHALQKVPGERYQSAGDFATDLERFLHAYSPVFTASKVVGLLRQVVGDPMGVPNDDTAAPEVRDGPMSTHQLAAAELAHHGEELRDENSVIFRVAAEGASQKVVAVKPSAPAGPKPKPGPAKPLPIKPAPAMVPRTARAVSAGPDVAKVPSLPRVGRSTPAAPSPVLPAPVPARAIRPRNPDEHTRELGSAPPGPMDELSGLLTLEDKPAAPINTVMRWDASETHPGDEDLENIGERTVITAAPTSGDYMNDAVGDSDYGTGDDTGHEGGEATLITQMPRPDTDEVTGEHAREDDSTEELPPDEQDDDGPTMSRDFTDERKTRNRAAVKPRQPAPAAFAAKIHAPAVSEIRKPKPSRRTPPGGFPVQGNVLQALVSAQVSEPMPNPAPPRPQPQQLFAPQQPQPQFVPPAFPVGSNAPGYLVDAQGMPIGLPTPPPGMPVQSIPGVPSHLQPYGQPQYQQPSMTPGALYQHQPYGAPPPQPMSITGQMRLFETDEIPAQYKIDGRRKRFFTIIVAGIVAVGVAGAVAFFIIRATRDTAPRVGAVHVESSPPGAEVVFDGTRLTDKTPLTVDSVQVGTRHEIRIELARYTPHVETIDIPKLGGEVPVTAMLKPITGKLVINTQPKGAEIKINDKVRGLTPATIPDVDMDSAKKLELRLKDYTPVVQDLNWPANGEIDLDIKLQK